MKLKLILPGYFTMSVAVLIIASFALKSKVADSKILDTKNMNQQISFSTYLLLNGRCKEAMEFYRSCFGGDLIMTTVGESPMKDIFPESMHNRMVNAKELPEFITTTAYSLLD